MIRSWSAYDSNHGSARLAVPHRDPGCRRTLGGPMPAADADLTLMIPEDQNSVGQPRSRPGMSRGPRRQRPRNHPHEIGGVGGGVCTTPAGALARRAALGARCSRRPAPPLGRSPPRPITSRPCIGACPIESVDCDGHFVPPRNHPRPDRAAPEGAPFTTLPGAGARRACAWRSMFWKAKTSPG
jgi:hypothetical protein